MSNIKDICCNPRLHDLRRRCPHAPVIHVASHFDHGNKVALIDGFLFLCRPVLFKGCPSSKSVVYATAWVYRELYEEIDHRKKCVNDYLIWNKISYLKCVPNLSLVQIEKPFWRRLVRLFETVALPSKRMQRPDVAPQIAFSSKEKVLNRNKTNSSLKPKKFHSHYVCFSGRKTRKERKNLP